MNPAEVRAALSALTSPLAGHPELEGAVKAMASAGDRAALGELVVGAAGDALVSWCAARAGRRDVPLAAVLAAASGQPSLQERAVAAARERVVEGPLLDALACAPLLGDGAQLALPDNAEARARLEILVWEAGASAVEVPHLGPWLWGSPPRSRR